MARPGSPWRRLAAACAVLAAAALLSSATVDARRLQKSTASPLDKVLSKYFTNDELVAHMKDFATRCSAISKLHLIGYSVRRFPLYVLEISDKPGQDEAEPHFKYIANMHGTETGGRQLLLGLAEWLCANHRNNTTAQRMVNGMHLWLMPTMNPDGYSDVTYENANGVNLNRDFPDPTLNPAMIPTGKEQPETKAVMNWTLNSGKQFIASANMHEGSFVANYPWDGTASFNNFYNATPDDTTFRHLATVYAQRNPQLKNSREFPGGITNGADWYVIYGGMQDWNYVRAGCFEITLELWENKGAAVLPVLFKNNLDSLTAYALTSTLGGLRGTVKDRSTNKPVQASITVSGSSSFVTRSGKMFGDFYRPLAPGKYNATVTQLGRGGSSKVYPFTVPADGSGARLAAFFP